MTAIPLPIRRDEVCHFRPDPEFTRLRAQEPVLRVDLPSGDSAYLISRYEDVRQVFGGKDGFGVGDVPVDILRDTADETRPHIPGNLLGYDPPERTGLRRLLTGQFTMRRMEWLKPRVTEILHNRLDAMEAAGVPADLLAEFALPAPSLVIWELLGVPYEDKAEFQAGANVLTDLACSMQEVETATAALDVVSFGESAVANECCGDGDEGNEVVGSAFVAAV